ncbi:MAG: hypothetical protein AAB675_04370 [Patescibacteria group bacterium]
MDDQNSQSNALPANPPVADTPIQTPPASPVQPEIITPHKSFFSGKLLLLIIAILILIFAGGGAYLALNSKTKPVPTVSQAVPTSAPTPTPDPTASWKTYTNADLGFSIKHPDSINVDEAEGIVVLFQGEKKKLPVESPIDPYPAPNIGFLKRSGSSARNACDLELCLNLSNPVASKTMKIIDIKINSNIDAVKITYSNSPYSVEYYIANASGSKAIRVGLTTDIRDPKNPLSEIELKSRFELLNQILSTFKFTQ